MWRFVLPRVALLHSHHCSFYSKNANINRHVGFLFALCAIATLPQPILCDVAAVEPLLQKQQQQHETQKQQSEECPFYGCPLFPQDVYYNVVVRQSLETMRSSSDTSSIVKGSVLESCGTDTTATLTLIGYKGGDPNAQINQDRALVVSPYYRVGSVSSSISNDDDTSYCRLLGVFDGHAKFGEQVSEYVVQELPKLLAKKLEPIYNSDRSNTDEPSQECTDADEQEQATKQALVETFVELDKTAPAEVSGGCTASVILQLDNKVYIANAGDSVSFLAVHSKSTNKTRVVYQTREDKPILPEERRRVEQMGGTVYNPERGTSRVLYTDPLTGYQSGLAMSRSIGDWEAGKVGVIPDPIVDVVDIDKVVKENLLTQNDNMCVVVDENGDMNMEPCQDVPSSVVVVDDDVHVFAVSATDGMMDFLDAQTIASTLATSLFHDDTHLLTACEQLISAAATGWQRAKQGRYRDDIAIAVSTIRIPPETTKPTKETQ